MAERLDLTETFRIGEETGQSDVFFGNIFDMAVNSSGDIYVVDGQAASVYVLSETGELTDRIGRKGEGPGEFMRARNVVIGAGDAVFVFDNQNYRLSQFEPKTHRYVYSTFVEGDDFSHPRKLIGTTGEMFLVVFIPPYWAPGSGTGVAA